MISQTQEQKRINLLRPKHWRTWRERRAAEQLSDSRKLFAARYRELTEQRFASRSRLPQQVPGIDDTVVEQQCEQLRCDGFVRWNGLFSNTEWLVNARQEMQNHINDWQRAFENTDAACRQIGNRKSEPVLGRMNFPQDGRARISFARNELATPAFAELMQHAGIREVVSRYFDCDAECNYLLAERLHAAQRGDFWHVDRIVDQVKVMVLLTDVEQENGPIRYKPGTHRGLPTLEPIYHQVFASGPDYAYPPGPLVEQLQTESQFGTGSAGDVFIFDTLGVHSGTQCVSGHRDALVTTFLGKTEKTKQLLQLSEGRRI